MSSSLLVAFLVRAGQDAVPVRVDARVELLTLSCGGLAEDGAVAGHAGLD